MKMNIEIKKGRLVTFYVVSVISYHDINKVAFDKIETTVKVSNCKSSKKVLRTVIPLLSGQSPRSLFPYVLQT